MRRFVDIMTGTKVKENVFPQQGNILRTLENIKEAAYVPGSSSDPTIPSNEFSATDTGFVRKPKSRLTVVRDPRWDGWIVTREGKPLTRKEWGLTMAHGKPDPSRPGMQMPRFARAGQDGVLVFDDELDAKMIIEPYEDALRRRGYTD